MTHRSRNPSYGLLRAAACLTMLLLAAVSHAQTAERERLASWQADLDRVERSLADETLTAADLSELRTVIDPIRLESRMLLNEVAPRTQTLRARLGLTPAEPPAEAPSEQGQAQAPPEGEAQPELDTLTDLETVLAEARIVAARADDLADQVMQRRQGLLVARVMERSRSILEPGLWLDASAALPDLTQRLVGIADSWGAIVSSRGALFAFGVVLLAVLVAIALAVPVRRYLLALIARDPEAVDIPLLRKAAAAVWITLVNLLLPSLSLLIVYAALQAFRLVPPRMDEVLIGLIGAVALGSAIVGLARGLLAPSREAWRLAPLSSEAAERLNLIIVAGAFAFAFGLAGRPLLDVLSAPSSIVTLWRATFAIIIAGFAVAVLRTIPGGLGLGHGEEDDERRSLAWSWLLPLFWLASAACVLAAIFGFATFASFIAAQIVWSSTLLAVLYLFLILVDEACTAAFQARTRLGLTLSQTMGLSRTRIEQIGVVLSGVLRLLLIAAAALLMIAPYGLESGDVFGWLDTLFTGFSFAGITLSPSGILAAIVVFVVGLAATRGLQRWLDTRLLPHTKMDVGIRNSVSTGVGYVGVIIAGMVAASSLGLNLSNLALVAGALSLGIGFGLQSIVNNFVSGLILLAERPIKAGDWIVVGAEQGIVKRINVRATEVETFDRASVIIPNSDLISGVVKNWMHGDRTGRVAVNLGVDYGTDPQKLKDILITCAQDHAKVLIYPEPFVSFNNFGESSLDFTLFCFTADAGSAAGIASDLRYTIFERLKAEDIVIPYPQRDLNVGIRDVEQIQALIQAATAAKSLKPRAAKRAEAGEA